MRAFMMCSLNTFIHLLTLTFIMYNLNKCIHLLTRDFMMYNLSTFIHFLMHTFMTCLLMQHIYLGPIKDTIITDRLTDREIINIIDTVSACKLQRKNSKLSERISMMILKQNVWVSLSELDFKNTVEDQDRQNKTTC